MSASPPRRTRSSTSKANFGASGILGQPSLLQDPKFVEMVNYFANVKCMKALQNGQIRVVRRGEPMVYIPRVDIVNEPESLEYLAIFELPGLKSADINISLKDNYIVVQGIRKSPYTKSSHCTEESCPDAMDIDLESFRRNVRELRYGPFARRIKVPSGTKDCDVSATLVEGMLRVTWPKGPPQNDLASREIKEEPPSSLSPRSATPSTPSSSPKNIAATLQQI